MRRTLTTLGLVAAMLLMVALPASAAPNNKNNEFDVVPLDCGAPLGEIMVRPNPGEGQSAWNVDGGEHYVAKRFEFADEVTIQITDGEGVSDSFGFVEDFGSNAPANGRKDLVECVDTFADEFTEVLDEEFAAILNSEFNTDIFAEGQEVTISFSSTFTVLVFVPGN